MRDWLTEQRQAVHTSSWSSAENVTVAEFLDRYISDVAANRVRPQTLRTYQDRAKLNLAPRIGKIKLSALRADHIQKLYADLQREGVAPGTVLISHNILRQALNQAMAWNLIARNPATMVRPPRNDQRKPRLPTKEEIDRFLEATKGHWIHAAVVLAMATCMRKGELLGLHWKDVDLEAGYVDVKHGVVRLDHGTILAEPKTRRGLRRVTLPAFAVAELTDWRQICSSPDLVFPNQHGSLMHPSEVNEIWQRNLKALDIPRCTFHSLRHLSATTLLEAGISAKVVQERLGHSSISITLGIYSHVTPKLEREAADAIQQALS